jgi:hypothetical protein
MGSPISNLVKEILLLYFQLLIIIFNIHNKSITSEARDVVDILSRLRYQHVTKPSVPGTSYS